MKTLVGLVVVVLAAAPSCKRSPKKPGPTPSPVASPALDAAAAPPSALTVVGKLEGAKRALFCGDRVLVVGDAGKVRLWQPTSNQSVERTVNGEVIGCGALGHVLTRPGNGQVELLRLLEGPEDCIGEQAAALSPDGRHVALAGTKVQILALEASPGRGSSPQDPLGPCAAVRPPGLPKLEWTTLSGRPKASPGSELFFDPEGTTLGVRGEGLGVLWQLSAPSAPSLFKARQDAPVATRKQRLAVITEAGTINVSGGAGAEVDLATTGKVTALMLTPEVDAVVVGLEDGSVTRHVLANKAATVLGNLGEPVATLALAAGGGVTAAGATRAVFWGEGGKELARVQGDQVAVAADARSVVTVAGGTAQVSTVSATSSR